jgi:hypothetical protein
MVVAARLVHYWTRGDGGVGASASEFVSFPCDLDVATLDTRYGLASQTPSAESAPTTGIVRRYLHRLNVRPWAVVLFLMLLSLVFLPIFEVEANRETGTYYGDRIFGSLAVQLRTSTWLPALLALGFATGFIHYLLDRSVYRMSDPQVRAAASGLIGKSC